MGFLSKIFGSKAVSSDIDSVKNSLKDCIQRMKDTLDEINTAELDAEANKKLYAVVKESRLRFTVRLQDILEKISVPEGSDYDSLKRLHSSLVPVIESVQKGNLKYAYYLDFSFGNQMKALKTQFRVFLDSANKLENFLRSVEEKRLPAERAEGLKLRFIELGRNAEELNKKLESLHKIRRDNEDKLDAFEKELNSANSEANAKLFELNKGKGEASSKIFSLISPANRALKKYEKAGVFDKLTGKMLLMYINDPVKAACEDNGEILRVIINSLLKMIDSSQLDVKESSKAKVIELNSNLDSVFISVKKIGLIDEEISALKKINRGEEENLNRIKTSVKTAERLIALTDKDIQFTEQKLNENSLEIKRIADEINKIEQGEMKAD